jgi:hypothetical protein
MEASDVTLNMKTCYVVISLVCHPEDGGRLYGVAHGELVPHRFSLLLVETIFSTTFKMATNIL